MAGIIMEKEYALSELISALLLISVLVAASAVILAILSSQYPPEIIPDPRLDIWNETSGPDNIVFVQSQGGDELKKGDYYFRVIKVTGESSTFFSDSSYVHNTSGSSNFTTGNIINFSVPISPDIASIQVIYRKNGLNNPGQYDVLMYEKKFIYADLPSTPSPSGYYTIRILSQGEGTITHSGPGTRTIESGFSVIKDIPIGTSITLSVQATSPNIITSATNRTEFWTPEYMLPPDADTIPGTGGSTMTFTPPMDQNQTVFFGFTLPESRITVYNVGGGGIATNGTITIPDGGSYTFTVPSGDPFDIDFISNNPGIISVLKEISGTAPNGNAVLTGGTDVSGAANTATFTYVNSSVTHDISLAVRFSPQFTITATSGQGGNIDPVGVNTYPAGSTPEYTIIASGENRTYEILVDGIPWTDGFNPALRTQTYTFSPLTSSHTIHARFAIQGVWGNYWGNAAVNGSYNDPDINRAVGVRNSNPWRHIESGPAWNKQLHHHIQLADAAAMAIPASPPYSTLEAAWPNGANRVVISDSTPVGSGSSKDYFYVKWSGLMFLEQPGSYRFWIRADDGIKLFIDGNMQSIDARAWIKPFPPDAADWYPCTTNPAVVIPGWHQYMIWYYENGGKASAELRFQPPGEPSNSNGAPFFQELFYLVD